MIALTYLDVVVVAVAAPVAIALGAPVLGCALGAGGWIVQRIVHWLDRRWTAKLREPRAQLGANLFEAFGRIWLLAGAIIVAGRRRSPRRRPRCSADDLRRLLDRVRDPCHERPAEAEWAAAAKGDAMTGVGRWWNGLSTTKKIAYPVLIVWIGGIVFFAASTG